MNSSIQKQRWRDFKLWSKLLGKYSGTLGRKLVNGIRPSVLASFCLLKLGHLHMKTNRQCAIFLDGYLSKRWLSGPSERYSQVVELSSHCEKIDHLKEAEKIYNGKFSKVSALRKEGLGLESEKTCLQFSQTEENVKIIVISPKQTGKTGQLLDVRCCTELHYKFSIVKIWGIHI